MNQCGAMLKIADDPFSDKYYTNMAVSNAFTTIVLHEVDQHYQYFLWCLTTTVP